MLSVPQYSPKAFIEETIKIPYRYLHFYPPSSGTSVPQEVFITIEDFATVYRSWRIGKNRKTNPSEEEIKTTLTYLLSMGFLKSLSSTAREKISTDGFSFPELHYDRIYVIDDDNTCITLKSFMSKKRTGRGGRGPRGCEQRT